LDPLIASSWWPPILQIALGGLIGAAGAITGEDFRSGRSQIQGSLGAKHRNDVGHRQSFDP
jgi:hypothetical protein